MMTKDDVICLLGRESEARRMLIEELEQEVRDLRAENARLREVYQVVEVPQ